MLLVLALYPATALGETFPLFTPDGASKELMDPGAIPVPGELLPARRARAVQVGPALTGREALRKGDRLHLNLFEDAHYTAEVSRVAVNINGTVTVRARIPGSAFGFAVFATTGTRSVGVIHVPERNARYHVQSGPDGTTHYLLELAVEKLDEPLCGCEGGADAPGVVLAIPEADASAESQSAWKDFGDPMAPARIDVMVVYTPAARAWADEFGGGMDNVLAIAMEVNELVHENSETGASFPLVHAAEVDYNETPCAMLDLRRLTVTPSFDPWNASSFDCEDEAYPMHGFMDEVHAWREQHAADLVMLLTAMRNPAGIAWLMNLPGGRPYYAFSVVGVRYAASGYTPAHEMAHNLGCGHHKEQQFQAGPGLFPYAAGGRWVGEDEGRYVSIMSYAGGQYYEDGFTHTAVPHLSDPAILYAGVPTGDALDADNARTVRETKLYASGYRSRVTFVTDGTAGSSIEGATSQVVTLRADSEPVEAIAPWGWHFVNWTRHGGFFSNDAELVIANVHEDIHLVANFTLNLYALRYTAEPQGAILGPSTQTVVHGSDGAPVSVVSFLGYTFAEWSDGSTDNPRQDFNVSGNIGVTATFRTHQHLVAYLAGAGGWIQGLTQQVVVNGGNAAAVMATPDPGHHFVQWSDGVTENPRRDTQVTEEFTVTALFQGDAPAESVLTGAVIDAQTETPVSCVVMVLRGDEAEEDLVVVVDANGDFVIGPQPGGPYTVRVMAPGYEPTVIEGLMLTDGGEAPLLQDIALSPLDDQRTVSGRVTDARTGAALVGVRVRASMSDEQDMETATCADGYYELALPGGEQSLGITLEFQLANYHPSIRPESMEPGASLVIDESLQSMHGGTGSIAGQVTALSAKNGGPLEGAQVVLLGPINAAVQTDAAGRYAFQSLLDGTYLVTASAVGYRSESRQRGLAVGGEVTMNFTLESLAAGEWWHPADINRDGVINAVDVQLVINSALGDTGDQDADVNGDGTVNAVDVQIVVNAALGIAAGSQAAKDIAP